MWIIHNKKSKSNVMGQVLTSDGLDTHCIILYENEMVLDLNSPLGILTTNFDVK